MSKANGNGSKPGSPGEPVKEWPPLKRGEDFFAIDFGGYKHNTFRAFVGETPLEELLKPRFWSVVHSSGETLREWDRVIAINSAGDTRYWREFLVVSGDPVQLQLLREHKLDAVQSNVGPQLPPGYNVVRVAETGEWQGVRVQDGHPMTPRMPKYDDAYRELKNHAIFRQ